MTIYGWALAKLGHVEEGISQIHAALDAQLSRGGQLVRPQFLAFLADVHLQAGDVEKGISTVGEGLATSKRTENSIFDAELLRLQGEFFKMQGNVAEAEASFQNAIRVSRRQAAKSLELRASTSLARLWQKHGKRKEAQQMLDEIYGWFTEGFNTADLGEAASLLKELS